ncbi:MAG: hypothetical protein J6P62_05660 [Bacteroidales bacterium]|nr:hypothetical protein [Bacteroidales bacterium]
MARLVLNGALKRNVADPSANPVAGPAGPRYAFIAHPACCPKCTEMDSRRTGRLYTIGDTWRISHINCLCSTVEVPAGVGMDPQSVIGFAMNPVGGILRRGFNFGQSLAPVKLTAGNWEKALGKAARMAEPTVEGRRKVLARAKITAQRKGAYRKAYNKAKDTWNDVLAPQPKPKKARQPAGAVRVRKARSETPIFTPTGRFAKAAKVDVQAKKRKAAKVAANRRASGDTKKLARLFGASIR